MNSQHTDVIIPLVKPSEGMLFDYTNADNDCGSLRAIELIGTYCKTAQQNPAYIDTLIDFILATLNSEKRRIFYKFMNGEELELKLTDSLAKEQLTKHFTNLLTNIYYTNYIQKDVEISKQAINNSLCKRIDYILGDIQDFGSLIDGIPQINTCDFGNPINESIMPGVNDVIIFYAEQTSFNHIGNNEFKTYIRTKLKEYLKAYKEIMTDKFSETIFEELNAHNIRFLKPYNNDSFIEASSLNARKYIIDTFHKIAIDEIIKPEDLINSTFLGNSKLNDLLTILFEGYEESLHTLKTNSFTKLVLDYCLKKNIDFHVFDKNSGNLREASETESILNIYQIFHAVSQKKFFMQQPVLVENKKEENNLKQKPKTATHIPPRPATKTAI
jgi:hypothetical protein